MPRESSTDRLLSSGVMGVDVTEFYSVVCPRLRIPKRAAVATLRFLESSGYIRIVWHSPHGARYFATGVSE